MRALLPPLAVTRQPVTNNVAATNSYICSMEVGTTCHDDLRQSITSTRAVLADQSPLRVEVAKVIVQRRCGVVYSLMLAEVWTSRRFT